MFYNDFAYFNVNNNVHSAVYNVVCCRSRVVVTETFDCGLLGEHILCTLSHAWQYLLSCDSQVIRVMKC